MRVPGRMAASTNPVGLTCRSARRRGRAALPGFLVPMRAPQFNGVVPARVVLTCHRRWFAAGPPAAAVGANRSLDASPLRPPATPATVSEWFTLPQIRFRALELFFNTFTGN